MQDSSAGPSNYGQGKVAIPKLDRPPPPPPKASAKIKEDRVTRACKTCRKRKVRCSGEVPQCANCQTNDLDCVYEPARRDRLKEALQLNQNLISLLKDLSVRVDENDKGKIHDALEGAEDDLIAPAPALSIKSSGKRPRKRSTIADEEGDSEQYGEAFVTASVGSNEDLDFVGENLLRDRESRETGYVGQNSEIQWLRSVQRQTEDGDTEPYGMPRGPPGAGRDAVNERSNALHERRDDTRQKSRKGSMKNVTDANFYLDSDNLAVDIAVDPYEMPDPDIAERLFNCYMDTVHSSFPLLPTSFEDQFRRFIESIKLNRPFQIPEKWRATMNLLFAIGAKYSHLIGADWKGDDRDHLLYMTRAVHLLGLNNTVMMISGPDEGLVQATGLLSLYFLVIGHVSRAWIMIGISMRFALALGLHLRNEDPSAEGSKRQSLVKTWWSLHAVECLMSSITGRPPIMAAEDCTVSLPQTALGEQDTDSGASRQTTRIRTTYGMPQTPTSSSTFASDKRATSENRYFVAHVNVTLISQKVLLNLYSPRTAAHSWEQVQTSITELLNELEGWAEAALPKDASSGNITEPSNLQRTQFLLRIHYWSTKILITRPCLCRIERRIAHQSDRSEDFNSRTAGYCVDAAQQLVKLFPNEPDPKLLYLSGPWWTLVHIIMQSMAVLLLEMAYNAQHMNHQEADLTACIKKLIHWLLAMRNNDPVAGRAYLVVWRILKTCAPALQSQANELLAKVPEPSHHAHPSQSFHDLMEQPQAGSWQPPDFSSPQIDTSATFDPQLYDQQSEDPFFGYQSISHPYFSSDQMQTAMNFSNPFVTRFDQGAPIANMNDLWPRPGDPGNLSVDFFDMNVSQNQQQDHMQQQAQEQMRQQMQQMEHVEQVPNMDYSPSRQH